MIRASREGDLSSHSASRVCPAAQNIINQHPLMLGEAHLEEGLELY